MSYFAKPNFIVYDEWFDDNLEKTKRDNKKLKKISHIHEYFYEKSNYKVGASENNLQLDIKLKKEIIAKNYFENTLEKSISISNKK